MLPRHVERVRVRTRSNPCRVRGPSKVEYACGAGVKIAREMLVDATAFSRAQAWDRDDAKLVHQNGDKMLDSTGSSSRGVV